MALRRNPAPQLPAWLDTMVPFQRWSTPMGGWDVHVMETGAGRPVFMVHGNPTWGFLYRKVAQMAARRGFHCIMPDMVGLGFSSKPRDPGIHTVDFHAGIMAQLADGMDLRGAILVVQDWGGPVGVLAAAAQRERFAGMVVMNTMLGPPREGFRPTPFHRFARVPVVADVVFRGLGFPQSTMWMAQGDKLSIRGRVARAYRFPLRHMVDNVAPLALARMVPDSHAHPSIEPLRRSEEFCRGFTGPVAVVWGDRDPVLGRAFKRVQAVVPYATVARTRAGHFLQEEVPEVIADAISSVHARLGTP